MYLLRISAVSHWLVVIMFQKYVTKLTVRNVLNDMPFNRKLPTPSVLLPVLCVVLKINRSNHLSNPTKLSTSIDLDLDPKNKISKVKHVYHIEVYQYLLAGIGVYKFPKNNDTQATKRCKYRKISSGKRKKELKDIIFGCPLRIMTKGVSYMNHFPGEYCILSTKRQYKY